MCLLANVQNAHLLLNIEERFWTDSSQKVASSLSIANSIYYLLTVLTWEIFPTADVQPRSHCKNLKLWSPNIQLHHCKMVIVYLYVTCSPSPKPICNDKQDLS